MPIRIPTLVVDRNGEPVSAAQKQVPRTGVLARLGLSKKHVSKPTEVCFTIYATSPSKRHPDVSVSVFSDNVITALDCYNLESVKNMGAILVERQQLVAALESLGIAEPERTCVSEFNAEQLDAYITYRDANAIEEPPRLWRNFALTYVQSTIRFVLSQQDKSHRPDTGYLTKAILLLSDTTIDNHSHRYQEIIELTEKFYGVSLSTTIAVQTIFRNLGLESEIEF